MDNNTIVVDGPPIISAVIPVKNGYPDIQFCVEALLNQSISLKKIIVIDSGSTDGTIEYLRGINKVELIEIAPEEFNHGSTRNIGHINAEEDFLFYTVQDAVAMDGYLIENLLKGFLDEEVVGVCGKQVVPHDTNKNPMEWYLPISKGQIKRVQYKMNADFLGLIPEEMNRVCGWDNVCAVYKTSALRENPFQKVVFGEDMCWAKEVLINGKALVYQENAIVYHYHHENPAFTFKRTFTTIYFRYKNFKIKPSVKAINLIFFTKLIYSLVKRLDFKITQTFKWFIYNVKRVKAANKAIRLFYSTLDKGELELEQKHYELCAFAPMPPKLNDASSKIDKSSYTSKN